MILSIIIPVYNIERYLVHCLDSVLACNLKDCEILLSLGKSEDDSDSLCEHYRQRFSGLIHIVHQDGTGLSNARNCAMQVAVGDFFLFLDGDDYVDSSVLNGLIDILRSGTVSADLIVTDFYHVEHPNGKLVPYFQIGEQTPVQQGVSFLPIMLRHRQCFWNVWRYIYRKSFLDMHQIRFAENLLSEDVDFTTSIFLAEPEVFFTHSPYYYYNVGRGESLMDRPTLARLKETVFVLSKSIERMKQAEVPFADLIAARYQFEYILNIALTIEIDKGDRAQALALYDGCDAVLSGSTDYAVRLFRVFHKLAGTKNCAAILHVMKQIRRWRLGRI